MLPLVLRRLLRRRRRRTRRASAGEGATMPRRRGRKLALGAGLLGEVAVPVLRGQRPGRVVVRCRAGHLYTTLWIPLASVKSLRLGPWRLQWCPVGRHVSLVTPVDLSALTPEERRQAAEITDAPVP